MWQHLPAEFLQLDGFEPLDMGQRADAGLQFGGGCFVGAQCHDGLAARRAAPHMHEADVDVGVAQKGADSADDAWPVVVQGEQDMASSWKIDPQIVDGDDVGRILENGAPHSPALGARG